MDDPNIIATLIPLTELTSEAVQKSERGTRSSVPPPEAANELPDSRGSTPAPPSQEDLDAVAPRLVLTFSKPPKNSTQGFVFGTDAKCDVRLGSRKTIKGVSRYHFAIALDKTGGVSLHDFSRYGTAVSFDTQARHEKKNDFKWMILPGYKDIVVRCEDIGFKIVLGRHDTTVAEYKRNVERFFMQRNGSAGLMSSLQDLDILSSISTALPSGAQSPTKPSTQPLTQAPIYIFPSVRVPLGRGTSGHVETCIDVSTGQTYAVKIFQDHTWKSETKFLKSLGHDRIIKFVDFQPTTPPRLIMEYMPLGSLVDQERFSPISISEIFMCLTQVLDALEFLHGRGFVHRDIKPANILVAGREPYQKFQIKLADYGLVKEIILDESCRMTFCGTQHYGAPEIVSQDYTSAVDIWSMGVVALEYSYGLPEESDSMQWPQRVVEWIGSQKTSVLTELLAKDMLQLESAKRGTAQACLKAAHDIEYDSFITKPHSFLMRVTSAHEPPASATIANTPGADAEGHDPDRTIRPASPDRFRRSARSCCPGTSRNESRYNGEAGE